MIQTLLTQAEDYAVPSAQELMEAQKAAEAAAAATAGAGLFFGGLLIFWAIFGLLSFAFFIWWIFLIIDLAKRDFPQKSTYLILMIVSLFVPFMLIVMDFVYYFGVVKKGVGTKSA